MYGILILFSPPETFSWLLKIGIYIAVYSRVLNMELSVWNCLYIYRLYVTLSDTNTISRSTFKEALCYIGQIIYQILIYQTAMQLYYNTCTQMYPVFCWKVPQPLNFISCTSFEEQHKTQQHKALVMLLKCKLLRI